MNLSLFLQNVVERLLMETPCSLHMFGQNYGFSDNAVMHLGVLELDVMTLIEAMFCCN
jgi:hypothetical protein